MSSSSAASDRTGVIDDRIARTKTSPENARSGPNALLTIAQRGGSSIEDSKYGAFVRA